MEKLIFAEQNDRIIPLEDKIFGISRLAKEMEKEKGKSAVVNATIGSLLDDEGNLVILSSVVEVLKNLTATDYADYAPIGGMPEFKQNVQKAAFGDFVPDGFMESVATPGGTGAIRSTISNFSKPGDKILTSDWYWAPYSTIAQEIGRKIETYALFDESGRFNSMAFAEKAKQLAEKQGSLVTIINTPAHNPTGYSLTLEDWDQVLTCIKEISQKGRKVTLLVDMAYIDFAGDIKKCRSFLPKLSGLPENVLVIFAYSLSKTFTLYGMRSGAMICLTKSKEIADEFKRVCEFSARGTWSNCTRSAMSVLTKIYEDPAVLSKVDAERNVYQNMLLQRGRAFEKAANEAGLSIVPFDTGFFASIPCDNPEEVGLKLQKEGIFLVPLAKGLRVSVASISEEKCKLVPQKVLLAMK